jgi:hypothetical protein
MSQLVKTKRQTNFKDFKRFGAFNKELVEQKTSYSTRLCVNWALFGTRGSTHAIKSPLYTRTG